MGKKLILLHDRGAACLLVILCLFRALPANAAPICEYIRDGGDTETAPCAAAHPQYGVPPSVCFVQPGDGPESCTSIGFTNFGNGGYYGSYSAAVPELEDYAAAAFLALALTIGWQVRQRRSVG